MSEQQARDALLGYAQELSFYINNGIATLLEFGHDSNIIELIEYWQQIRHTIILELGIV